MRCGITNAYILDKTMYKMLVSSFSNVQSGYLFLKLENLLYILLLITKYVYKR